VPQTARCTLVHRIVVSRVLGRTNCETTSFEIEAGDDFVFGSQTIINAASLVGLLVLGPTGGLPASRIW
jgi:hypothetical protein